MTQEEQKEYYGKATALWKAAKADRYEAMVALDMAEMITDFLGSPNTEETWARFIRQIGELAQKYPDGAPRLMLDWMTHDVSRAIEGKAVSEYVGVA